MAIICQKWDYKIIKIWAVSLECIVCKNKIGFLQKKIKLNDTDYCHEDCYYESEQGKAYLLLINARVDFYANKYSVALTKVNKALQSNFYRLDLLALKSMILGGLGKYEESLKVGLDALDLFDQKYGKNYIIDQVKAVRLNKLSEDWLLQNQVLVDLYGDTLAGVTIGYMKTNRYKEGTPFIKKELEIYPDHEPAKLRLKICNSKLKK